MVPLGRIIGTHALGGAVSLLISSEYLIDFSASFTSQLDIFKSSDFYISGASAKISKEGYKKGGKVLIIRVNDCSNYDLAKEKYCGKMVFFKLRREAYCSEYLARPADPLTQSDNSGYLSAFYDGECRSEADQVKSTPLHRKTYPVESEFSIIDSDNDKHEHIDANFDPASASAVKAGTLFDAGENDISNSRGTKVSSSARSNDDKVGEAKQILPDTALPKLLGDMVGSTLFYKGLLQGIIVDVSDFGAGPILVIDRLANFSGSPENAVKVETSFNSEGDALIAVCRIEGQKSFNLSLFSETHNSVMLSLSRSLNEGYIEKISSDKIILAAPLSEMV